MGPAHSADIRFWLGHTGLNVDPSCPSHHHGGVGVENRRRVTRRVVVVVLTQLTQFNVADVKKHQFGTGGWREDRRCCLR